MSLPVPVAGDHDTAGFFEAAQRGYIAICFCAGCGATLHLPRPHCSACGISKPVWRDVAPFATVYSWTVIRHAVMPAFAVPYTVALVELDAVPGVRLLAHFDGVPEFSPITRVRARFDDVRDGVVVPQWEII
jgi:uncharacterized OB-fold protein